MSHQVAAGAHPEDASVLGTPYWLGVFLAIAVPASLVLLVPGFLLGLSVSDDVVFGTYALISGALADFIIRTKFRRVLVVFERPRVPFIAAWALLCLYVAVFSPFEA